MFVFQCIALMLLGAMLIIILYAIIAEGKNFTVMAVVLLFIIVTLGYPVFYQNEDCTLELPTGD